MPDATVVPAKPRMSLFRKILLWLLALMLLVLAFIGLGLFWIFAPPGTTERWRYQLKGAVGMRLELPECRSRMVETELWSRYGNIISGLNRIAVVTLRRAKEVSYDPQQAERHCSAEYSTPLGVGDFEFTVTWYDPQHPSVSELTVIVDEKNATFPELIERLKNGGSLKPVRR